MGLVDPNDSKAFRRTLLTPKPQMILGWSALPAEKLAVTQAQGNSDSHTWLQV